MLSPCRALGTPRPHGLFRHFARTWASETAGVKYPILILSPCGALGTPKTTGVISPLRRNMHLRYSRGQVATSDFVPALSDVDRILLIVTIAKDSFGLFVPWIAPCQYGPSKCGYGSLTTPWSHIPIAPQPHSCVGHIATMGHCVAAGLWGDAGL